MNASELMTANVHWCVPESYLCDISRVMSEAGIGLLPVVESAGVLRPVGVVTDRDIVCRTVSKARNPVYLQARDVMSTPPICVREAEPAEVCIQTMEEHGIRRLLVVDKAGLLKGVISQADVARRLPADLIADLVRRISGHQATEARPLRVTS